MDTILYRPQIQQLLQISAPTLFRKLPEFKRAGIIFYKWRPSASGKKRVMCAFESELKKYIRLKARRGEML